MKAVKGKDLIVNSQAGRIRLSLILLLCAVSAAAPVTAQHFSWKSRLTPVTNTGFYTIPLSPELTALSQDHWRDLRLMDDKGKEIPYLLKQSEGHLSSAPFVSYDITHQEANDSLQYIVIANAAKARIDHILLEMANADATRTLSVSGSNDQRVWYVVKDDAYFNAPTGATDDRLYKEVAFPLTNYVFYKITIHNGRQQPLNITRAGYLEQQQTIQAAYSRVPGISFTQKDSSDKTSYIRISCTPANRIDRLVLHIGSPARYHRSGTIAIVRMAEAAANETGSSAYKRRIGREADRVELSSDREPVIDLSAAADGAKYSGFELTLFNQDNQPLHIDSISACQAGAFLVAELEKGKTYDLYFGDTALSLPEYDIVYFQNKIPENSSSIAAGPVTVNEHNDPAVVKASRDNSRYLVWAGLGIAGIAIAFMTTRMLRDMNKGK